MARIPDTSPPASDTAAPASDTAPTAALAARLIPGVQAHPHARAVLAPGLPPHGSPSHAYLFHGPPGTGKRTVAREFACALLADGAPDPDAVRGRVSRGTHPDLTWVTPSGAAEVLVGDVDEPVVAAATRTPFESSRRVFVIEAAHTLNDQAANRLLKTLEEPPSFAHLLLLTDRREDVMATIASRCLQVRFDPLPAEAIAQRLLADAPTRSGDAGAPLDGAEAPRSDADLATARACARLALGDVRLASLLASDEGRTLRAAAQAYVRSPLAGSTAERPWTDVLEVAKAAGVRSGESVAASLERELELSPAKERRRLERESLESRRRAERRARAGALEQMLRLAELWLRDLLCMAEGSPELVHNVDRLSELEEDLSKCPSPRARGGIDFVQDTRLRLTVNVSEELALEALAHRLQAIGPRFGSRP
jgi:DNA polymerase III subunit delta'